MNIFKHQMTAELNYSFIIRQMVFNNIFSERLGFAQKGSQTLIIAMIRG